jgi:hypothetical protein
MGDGQTSPGDEGAASTYVDALAGEAWRHGRGFLFGFGQEDGELFDGGHGDVTPVVTGKKGLRGRAVSLGGAEGAHWAGSIPCP